MKVSSNATIKLLDAFIALAEQLHVILDENTAHMEESVCYNTLQSTGAPKLP